MLSLRISLLKISWVEERLKPNKPSKLKHPPRPLNLELQLQLEVLNSLCCLTISTGSGERVFASPLAKKIAAEKGIDLSQIRGSGPEGRILKHDVEEQAASLSQRVETQQAQPTTEKKPEKKVEKEPKFVEAPNPYIDIPVSNMRDVIAKRLLESKTTIPHYYLTSEIVMDKIIKYKIRNLNLLF